MFEPKNAPLGEVPDLVQSVVQVFATSSARTSAHHAHCLAICPSTRSSDGIRL